MSINVSRINITLPKNLADDLKVTISPRERSKVIAEALKRELTAIKREKALKKLKGTWAKFGGVPLKSDADIKAWRRSLWSSSEKRFTGKISG